ncbi:trypsin-like peptidase domain-containing protein [Chlamydiia bacterium]|nr:trypsin-like peptidase domain-containing protein [Chlamydiia bacterium]
MKRLITTFTLFLIQVSTSYARIPGDSFSELTKQLLPSVVEIQTDSGFGSGFIIDKSGVILTNHHVVEGMKTCRVVTADGYIHEDILLLGSDPGLDLAILKIETPNIVFDVVTLGNSDEAEIGDWILAIGNPYGLGTTVTAGIISARNRVIALNPFENFIQTDAPINPGNSGGPMFNMKGELIGINSARLEGGALGIGFAVPYNLAKRTIYQLYQYGTTKRGWIGMSVKDMNVSMKKVLGVNSGVLVNDIVSGGPAEKAGIKRGDVIIQFNDSDVTSAQQFPLVVAESEVNQKVSLKLIRHGKTISVTAKLGLLEKSITTKRKSLGIEYMKSLMVDVIPVTGCSTQKNHLHGLKIIGMNKKSVLKGKCSLGDTIIEVFTNKTHYNRTFLSVVDVKNRIEKLDEREAVMLLLITPQGETYYVGI